MTEALMSAQAIIIAGAESTGTRFLKSIFILNGYDGTEGHSEKWGNGLEEYSAPDPMEYPAIVWRFSYPMGLEIPRIDKVAYLLDKAGYRIKILICVRDGWCSSRHGQTDAAQVAGYKYLFEQIYAIQGPARCRIISYESLCSNQNSVFNGLNLIRPIEKFPEICNGNDKYYKVSEDLETHD